MLLKNERIINITTLKNERKYKISVRTSLADYKKTDDLYDIPLYMIEFLDKIIK